jgi:hypothetical protein
MIKYKMERVVDPNSNGYHAKMMRVPDCTFAASPLNRSFYCIHRGQKDEFLHYLTRCGVKPDEIKVIEVPFYEPTKANIVIKDGWVPKENQVPVVDYILDDDPLRILPVQTGFGKSQPLYTPIRTPGGWTTMGELSVGSVVSGADGKPTKVTAIYPQPPKEVFELTFYDGRKVRACAEHLWQSYYVNTTENQRWKVRDTAEIMRLINMPNPRVYLPLIEPEDFAHKDLPLHPYLLGVLLGDGCLTSSGLTWCKPDEEIVSEVLKLLPAGYSILTCLDGKQQYIQNKHGPNELLAAAHDLGIMGKRAWEKSIPEAYFEGSLEQRLSVLQGLLDTDGTVGKTGSVSFSSSSEQLAKDVQRLVWSIGGIARMGTRIPHYTYKGERLAGRTDYRLTIRVPKPSRLFRLSRKRNRTDDNNQYNTKLKLQVKSIESVGVEVTQCISIDNESKLYVCGDYIATHNTFLALYSAYKMGIRWMLVTRGGYVDKWIEDVEKTYKIPRDRIIVIKGEKALLKAIDKAKQGDFDFDVILMSTGGYSDYIKHYEQYLGTELGDMYMDPRALGMLFGVGLRVVDEAHQMLHAYYRIDLYSHYPKVLFLSATILGNDALEKRVHEIIYPANKRYNGAEWKCYIHATGLKYNLAEPSKARFTDHRKNYSHVIFEQYLMRNKEKLKHYLNMIANLANDFLKKRKPGQKYLIFASTVDMCDLVVKDLKSRKYSGVVIGRYVAEDNLEDIYGYDIIVTTPGSGGTGIDIPDLATALSTSAISSGKLNIQMLGRLRELKNYPGEEPEYQYLICADIPKQLDYHRQKLELFQGKVKSHKVQHTGALI